MEDERLQLALQKLNLKVATLETDLKVQKGLEGDMKQLREENERLCKLVKVSTSAMIFEQKIEPFIECSICCELVRDRKTSIKTVSIHF